MNIRVQVSLAPVHPSLGSMIFTQHAGEILKLNSTIDLAIHFANLCKRRSAKPLGILDVWFFPLIIHFVSKEQNILSSSPSLLLL